jgi:hypothetical protein
MTTISPNRKGGNIFPNISCLPKREVIQQNISSSFKNMKKPLRMYSATAFLLNAFLYMFIFWVGVLLVLGNSEFSSLQKCRTILYAISPMIS